MSDAKLILQAVGDQDKFLTTDAKHTFFKKTYRQHSVFGQDWNIINANYGNSTNFGLPGSKHYFRIDKNGDTITEIYLRIKIKTNDAWSSSKFGLKETLFRIIKSIEFMYNDKIISKLDSDFIFSYYELHYTESEKQALYEMISYDLSYKNRHSDDFVYLSIPLPLWFHKNPGLSFPMWALYNPNVGINITLQSSPYFNLGSGEYTRKVLDLEILVCFAQLSSIEKDQFNNKPLEYLIEVPEILDTISIPGNATNKKFSVKKTHFVKYLCWNIKNNSSSSPFTYLDDVTKASITFNGNALIDSAPGSYFNQVNRYMYFNSGSTLTIGDDNNTKKDELNPIYTYSFSINPTKSKLSGYFTTEKFNDVTFDLNIKERSGTTRDINLYLVKHNIIRIKDGYLNVLYN